METGGFSVGRNRWLAFAGPAGVLEIYPDRLVLDVTWRRYSLPRSSIVTLRVIWVLFFRVLQIQHSVREYPRFLGFHSLRLSRVVRRLTEAGYRIESADA